MYCTNCGSKLEGDARFCSNCGILQEADEAVQLGWEIKNDETTMQDVKVSFLPRWLLWGGILFILAIFIIVGIMRYDSISNDASKEIIYIKNDSLYYVKNMDKNDNPIKIIELYDKDNNAAMEENAYSIEAEDGVKLEVKRAWFSDNKEYIYFYYRISDDGYATLCRVKKSKLEYAESNENRVEEIDTKVSINNMQIIGSDKFIYIKENGKLIYKDGSTEETIAKNIDEFKYNKEKNVIIYSKKIHDDNYELYYQFLNNGNGSELIDKNIYKVHSMSNPDFIMCKKNFDEGSKTYDLYIGTALKGTEKMATRVTKILNTYVKGKRTYYMVENKTSLYDQVSDDYAVQDAKISKPEVEDYFEQVDLQQVMSESDYNYYMIENPDRLAGFYEFLYYDDEFEMNYYYKLIESDSEEAVKEVFFYNDTVDIWYIYRGEDYDKDLEAYDLVKDRIQLRDELKEARVTKYSIYYYTDGKEPYEVCANAADGFANAKEQFVLYEKYNDKDFSVDINWFMEEGAVSRDTYFGNLPVEYTYCYYFIDGEEYVLDADGFYNLWMAENGKGTIIDTWEGLFYGKIADKKIIDLELVTEEGHGGFWEGDKFYFMENITYPNYLEGRYSASTGELYMYFSGQRKKITNDAYISSVRVYKDGNLLWMENDEESVGTLNLYDNNNDKSHKISSEVSSYTYIEKDRIVFLKDTNMYLFKGIDDIRKIGSNIDEYECAEGIEGEGFMD